MSARSYGAAKKLHTPSDLPGREVRNTSLRRHLRKARPRLVINRCGKFFDRDRGILEKPPILPPVQFISYFPNLTKLNTFSTSSLTTNALGLLDFLTWWLHHHSHHHHHHLQQTCLDTNNSISHRCHLFSLHFTSSIFFLFQKPRTTGQFIPQPISLKQRLLHFY